jgi:hypothetical protein
MVVGEYLRRRRRHAVFNDLVPNLYVMDLPQTKSVEGKLYRLNSIVSKAIERLTGSTIDVRGSKKIKSPITSEKPSTGCLV